VKGIAESRKRKAGLVLLVLIRFPLRLSAFAMSVLVALATYNEIETLPSLVAAIHAQLPEAHVLVVDDNSPDGTGQWCDEEAARSAWFSVIHRAGKLGLGSASWAAMQAAIDRGYEVLITLDADWSHPPEALPRLIEAAAYADVVIGSRYVAGGSIAGWPASRRAVSAVMNLATRAALGIPVRDASTACRLYRVELLRRLDFSKLTATGYAYLEEILWQLHRLGARFAEVPIAFSDRRAGASKVHFGEAWGKVAVLRRLAWQRLTGRD
jgi:dolichol-phosphate mannosyltransferase